MIACTSASCTRACGATMTGWPKIGISTAVVLALGVAVYLLAGGANSPRQETPQTLALTDPPSSTTLTTGPPAAPAGTISSAPPPAPTRAETRRPAVPSARPSPDRAPADRGAPRTLAQAWIAAGARGIDPDATPERLIFNRTAGLRDSWAKIRAKS